MSDYINPSAYVHPLRQIKFHPTVKTFVKVLDGFNGDSTKNLVWHPEVQFQGMDIYRIPGVAEAIRAFEAKYGKLGDPFQSLSDTLQRALLDFAEGVAAQERISDLCIGAMLCVDDGTEPTPEKLIRLARQARASDAERHDNNNNDDDDEDDDDEHDDDDVGNASTELNVLPVSDELVLCGEELATATSKKRRRASSQSSCNSEPEPEWSRKVKQCIEARRALGYATRPSGLPVPTGRRRVGDRFVYLDTGKLDEAQRETEAESKTEAVETVETVELPIASTTVPAAPVGPKTLTRKRSLIPRPITPPSTLSQASTTTTTTSGNIFGSTRGTKRPLSVVIIETVTTSPASAVCTPVKPCSSVRFRRMAMGSRLPIPTALLAC